MSEKKNLIRNTAIDEEPAPLTIVYRDENSALRLALLETHVLVELLYHTHDKYEPNAIVSWSFDHEEWEKIKDTFPTDICLECENSCPNKYILYDDFITHVVKIKSIIYETVFGKRTS